MAHVESANTRVLVLGGSGMLGSMVADYLSRDSRLEVSATMRTSSETEAWKARLPVRWLEFGGAADLDIVANHDWIVNCIGIIKPLIGDDNPAEVERAILIKGLLPYQLATAATKAGARVLQIATDCVWSGSRGRYVESDPHDALDVYGKTKSLGEVAAENVHHLRCSIVGPEPGRARSLIEWFLGQAKGANVNGFLNHRWNGVSTLHFAKLCQAVVTGAAEPSSLQHVLPTGDVTKYELLRCFADSYARDDIEIDAINASTVIDRTLDTDDKESNEALWIGAGYASPPSVPEMIAELAEFNYLPRASRATAASTGYLR